MPKTDLEKIQSQWNKLAGLLARHDASAAIVRAATATELATNLAIRKEFEARRQFTSEFVDSLLTLANGVSSIRIREYAFISPRLIRRGSIRLRSGSPNSNAT